jgi:hypothetical protein
MGALSWVYRVGLGRPIFRFSEWDEDVHREDSGRELFLMQADFRRYPHVGMTILWQKAGVLATVFFFLYQ